MTNPIPWGKVAKRIRVPMGFLFAAVFLWLAQPLPATLLISLLMVAPGLWLRAYASGYVRKNSELTSSGPYAYTRNPLYLGSMLIAFGFALAAASWVLLAILTALFAAIYIPTIQDEEQYLRTHFAGFNAYAAQVPRLIPRLRPRAPEAASGAFSRALYVQHREYNSLMGSAAIYAALLVKVVLQHQGVLGGWPALR